MRLPDSPEPLQNASTIHFVSTINGSDSTSNGHLPMLHDGRETEIPICLRGFHSPPSSSSTERYSSPSPHGISHPIPNPTTGWHLGIENHGMTPPNGAHTTQYPTLPPTSHQGWSSGPLPPPHSRPLYSCIPLPKIEETNFSLHPVLGYVAPNTQWHDSPPASSGSFVGHRPSSSTSSTTDSERRSTEWVRPCAGRSNSSPYLPRRPTNP